MKKGKAMETSSILILIGVFVAVFAICVGSIGTAILLSWKKPPVPKVIESPNYIQAPKSRKR